ncbi:MAG: glycosyltransferase family 4 protein, partial [bacterium]
VALEAMAAGKPVVASNVGGLREVLAGGACGILFDLDDETALGDAIVAILSDPARARRLVAAGARQVERFSVERHALELQKVYLRLAGRAVESGA